MQLVVSHSLLVFAAASYALTALLGIQSIDAAKVTIVNSCEHQIGLYDNSQQEVRIAPGATLERTVIDGFNGVFRIGTNPQATLAEFTHADDQVLYAIRIIRTSATQRTGDTDSNVPVQVAPLSSVNSATCRVLTCLADGCNDANRDLKDDTKTLNCPDATDFAVTFCPGGTTAAPTPVPTTQQPTRVLTLTKAVPVQTLSVANVSVAGKADQIVDDSSASSFGATPIETEVNPELTAMPQRPVFDTAGTSPFGPSEAAVSAEPPSTDSNIQRSSASASSSSSAVAAVVVAAMVALAAAVAVAAIVVVRRKQRAMEVQTETSPVLNRGLATV